jgi:hypothetical protein
VIVNYWKLGGEVVLRVLYLEVTGALKETDGREEGVLRVDLAPRKRRTSARCSAMAAAAL